MALQCLVYLRAMKFQIFSSIAVFGVPQSYETLHCSKDPKILGHEVHQPL